MSDGRTDPSHLHLEKEVFGCPPTPTTTVRQKTDSVHQLLKGVLRPSPSFSLSLSFPLTPPLSQIYIYMYLLSPKRAIYLFLFLLYLCRMKEAALALEKMPKSESFVSKVFSVDTILASFDITLTQYLFRKLYFRFFQSYL